tara:strand:- start:3467 stop:4390 length:924 start_codon:yes stop_codon:yes gene_type:complete
MFKDIYKIIEEYKKGTNLIKFLNENYSDQLKKNEITQLSYDIQAGSYSSKAIENPEFEIERGKAFAEVINSIGPFDSILEAGVGEATSMTALVRELSFKPEIIQGFDISFSRILFARDFLKDKFNLKVDLGVGDIASCPLSDNSVDLVYTIHALEPNGGNELNLLSELIRTTNKYLVLFEPSYELGSIESKKHIENHNYVKNLANIAESLGHEIIENKLIFDSNPKSKNNTGALVVKKNHTQKEEIQIKKGFSRWSCPISTKNLKIASNFLFSKESMAAYPIIKDIPILLKDKSILATSLPDFDDSL